MAEGGANKDTNGKFSTFGSEFVFDFYCELCRDDGRNEEANGYCRDCGEYLCDVCIRAHLRSRPTRYHDVLDQAAMPKDTPLSQDRVSKDISTKCQHHSNKIVEFYCPSHDALGCSICFTTVHKRCDATESVYDKSESIIDEYKTFTQKLSAIGKKSNDTTKKAQDNVAMLETCCRDTISDIRALKEEFIAIFEEMEQVLVTQVETTSSKDKENMEQLEKELMKTKTAVDELRIELEELIKSKRVYQLYIRMKEKKREASSLEDKVRTAEKSINVRSFKFAPNNDIKNVLRTTGLGKIVHITQVKNDKNTSATHIADINVKADRDACDCYVKGSVMLSDTLLVAVDYVNCNVKLVDTMTNNLKCVLKVSGRPFDVAKINDTKVAVSIYKGGKILIIKVADALSLEREISVSLDCRGVAYSQGKLLVTFYSSKRLDIMDLQGNVIKTLQNNDGREICEGPRHICVSMDGDSIYVSDYGGDEVRHLTLSGESKAAYIVLNTQKVCTDHCGNVYVAADEAKSVLMLTSDCVKIKEVVTKADGLERKVTSVSHCPGTNRLYVGMEGINIVKVYQLS